MIRIGLLTVVLLICACSRPDEPRNLLLITVDTLRADHLGCYGYGKADTPTIDGLARDGVLFERAYASAPTTLPSHASILTGLYPPTHGIRDNGLFRLPESVVTMAEVLEDRGFSTAAVTASDPLNQRFGLDQGFTYYDSTGVQTPGYTERRAQEITERASAWLDGCSSPFFLWVHYFDPHLPYDPPKPFSGKTPVENYDGEIAYTDWWIKRLLDSLDELEETLIVFTSDHGESLGEHGESSHSVFIYDATIHVPLILTGPGVEQGKQIDRPVRTVDIPCTVLKLLGAGALPAWPGAPREIVPSNLFEDTGPRVAYSESMTPAIRYGWSSLSSIRTSDWLFVEAPRQELYALDGSDRSQKRNLAGNSPAVKPLAQLLGHAVESMPQQEAATLEDALTEEELRAFEQLGYLLAHADTSLRADENLADPKDRIESAERLYKAARAQGKGRYNKAREHLQWVVDHDAENVMAWMLFGGLYEKEHDLEKAAEAYERVLEIRPTYWKALGALASVEVVLNRHEEAESHLRQALEVAPFSAELWSKMGQLKEMSGKKEAAIEAYRRLLQLDPGNKSGKKGIKRLSRD